MILLTKQTHLQHNKNYYRRYKKEEKVGLQKGDIEKQTDIKLF